MARGRLLDHLQTFKFHLLDVSVAGAGLIPVPVFVPVLGFSSITAPEMTADIETITEGNSEFPRKVVRKGTVSTITCQRGSQFFDSDFWRWTISSVKGRGLNSRRKTLLLVQFMNKDIFTEGAAIAAGLSVVTATSLGGRFTIPSVLAIQAGLIGVGAVVGLIPAKVWLLQQCIATRVKTASDFDASTGATSIMELDIESEFFEEFSLGS